MSKEVCEFFAGIGLVHEGLRGGNWKCVYAGDIDPKKKAMYEGHYGPSPHYHLADVWNTDEALAHLEGAPFLATASFPCTDMSLAGKRQGLAGSESSALLGFLRILEQAGGNRPRIVLLENVPGFLTSHGGADFRLAIDRLAAMDYWCDLFLVDAKWFLPQSRSRIFVIGYHATLAGPPLVRLDGRGDFLSDPWRQAVRRAEKLRPLPIRRAMEAHDLATGWATVDTGNPPQLTYRLSDYLDADATQDWWVEAETARHREMMSDLHRAQIEALEQLERPTLCTGFRRVRHGRQRLEVRFDGVAGCLRTPRGGSAKQIVLLAGRDQLHMRWMTPREYARLQGAGDYALPANRLQGLFGFGDAVCVPAIAWIDQLMLSPVYAQFAGAEQSESQGNAAHAGNVFSE